MMLFYIHFRIRIVCFYSFQQLTGTLQIEPTLLLSSQLTGPFIQNKIQCQLFRLYLHGDFLAGNSCSSPYLIDIRCSKIKDFRTQFRGVKDRTFFLFRLTKIYA